jgi:hypothetical protein
MDRLRKPSPALIVSGQPRCATDAVRGIALTTGAKTDLSSLSSSNYTSDASLFGYHWSCTGKAILVRKDARAMGVDIKFDGNPATVAVVSSAAGESANAGSATRQPDGSFLVVMGGSNTAAPGPWQAQWNVPFVIVLL